MTVTKTKFSLHPETWQKSRFVGIYWDKSEGWYVAVYFDTNTAGYVEEKKWSQGSLADCLTRFRKVVLQDERVANEELARSKQ